MTWLTLDVRLQGVVALWRRTRGGMVSNLVEGKSDRARLALRVLTLDGLMIGLSIVLTRLMSLNVPIGGGIGARIGLGHLPIVFTGIVAGPLSGLLVAAGTAERHKAAILAIPCRPGSGERRDDPCYGVSCCCTGAGVRTYEVWKCSVVNVRVDLSLRRDPIGHGFLLTSRSRHRSLR